MGLLRWTPWHSVVDHWPLDKVGGELQSQPLSPISCSDWVLHGEIIAAKLFIGGKAWVWRRDYGLHIDGLDRVGDDRIWLGSPQNSSAEPAKKNSKFGKAPFLSIIGAL